MKSAGNANDILLSSRQLGPFPMQKLRRVEKPTTLITENIQRVDERQHALNKAYRGDYGESVRKAARRLNISYPVSNALMDVMLGLRSMKENEVATAEAPVTKDPLILSRHIKRLGYFFKADIMGICRLPKHAVYSHDIRGNPIDIDYKYAIVIVVGKDYQTVKASTGRDWMIDALSFQCYQRLAFISRTMADYIRRLGYPAVADHSFKHPTGGMHVTYPPLLLHAGIGEISRAGIVLNPFLGIATKAAAVLTNLPLIPDKPIDFGLQDFCEQCTICADACPSKAIPGGDKVMYNGYETWKIDEQRCASFSLLNPNGTFCGTCLDVCPWTRPDTRAHNLVRWLVSRSGLARKAAIAFDDMTGRARNDNKKQEDKWWFDLEYVDGFLTIPKEKANPGKPLIPK